MPWSRTTLHRVTLESFLLEILACPEDKGPLYYLEDEDTLYNPRLSRRYRIENDIPVLLIDEAETVDQAEHDRIMGRIDAESISPTWEQDT
jgi:uncharacterized protein YbaR (Trm112 family)